MPWTTHGYWTGLREPTYPGPARLNCGGPHRCVQCALEAHRLEAEIAMTATEPAAPGVEQDVDLDIGHGVRIVYTVVGSHRPGGLIEYHLTPEGRECGTSVLFDFDGVRNAFPDRPVWTVQQLTPLTLTPSILCRRCGHHGRITSGRWRPEGRAL